MKHKIKIGALLLSICLVLPLFGMVAKAASGSLSISSTSGTVGSTVSITCKVTCSSGPIGSADVMLSYDQAALQFVSATNMAQGGSGRVQYSGATPDGTTKTLSFSMSFKILKAGSHAVSVTSGEAYDIDEVSFSVSGKGTITGKAPTTNNNNSNNNNNNNNNTTKPNKDSNNKLSSLKIHPGALSPAFSAGTTNYTVSVPGDTKEVTISATPQSNKASVSVSGGKDLKLGPNTAQVIVVAENGSSIAYNITIMCGEVEKIAMDGKEHTINENFSEEQLPKGFVKEEVTYNDRTYAGANNSSMGMKLMYLQSGETSDFFVYEEATKTFYPFAQVMLSESKFIVPLPLDAQNAEFENQEKTEVQIQGKTFDAWKLDDEFSIVSVMNQDGEELLYCYDSVDGTFQRQRQEVEEEVTPVVQEKTLFPNKYYMYVIVGLCALCFVLFVCLIYFIASRKKRRETRKIKAIKKMEKQKRKEEKLAQKNRE